MKRVLLVASFAMIVLAPFVVSRALKPLISPPAPPLPGLSIPLATPPAPGAISPMPAIDRVAAVRKRYLQAKSYRDQGEQSTKFSSPLSSETKAEFTTAFERGGRELWAYRESEESSTGTGWLYVVTSSDQKSFRSWWTIDPSVKITDSHDMAYAGPTGVSKGNAVMILPLLRGASSQASVSEAVPVDKGVEAIDGVQCAVLELTPREGTVVTLWVDADHAIRRIKEVSLVDSKLVQKLDPSIKDFDSFTSTTITTFKPVFDQPFPADVFEFDPAKRHK